jgi:hypothetical protein
LKIKECFNLKVNLNLGYLAKHLTSNEIINTFSFEYNDNEIEALCFVNLCIFELYAILAPKITEFKLHNSYHKIAGFQRN